VGASTSAYFASKYHHAVYEARTVVLNMYAVHLTKPAQRKETLAAVTAEINGLFPEMAADGVFFALAENGDVSLTSSKADDRVDLLITARLAARKAKNFAESDRIRDELAAMGIQLKDVKDPATGEIKTEWEVKR
jgi:cysteinyl-tRNA synthetase